MLKSKKRLTFLFMLIGLFSFSLTNVTNLHHTDFNLSTAFESSDFDNDADHKQAFLESLEVDDLFIQGIQLKKYFTNKIAHKTFHNSLQAFHISKTSFVRGPPAFLS